jgi:transposase-like protein
VEKNTEDKDEVKKEKKLSNEEYFYNYIVSKEACPLCYTVGIEEFNSSDNAANYLCRNCNVKFFVDYEDSTAIDIGKQNKDTL